MEKEQRKGLVAAVALITLGLAVFTLTLGSFITASRGYEWLAAVFGGRVRVEGDGLFALSVLLLIQGFRLFGPGRQDLRSVFFSLWLFIPFYLVLSLFASADQGLLVAGLVKIAGGANRLLLPALSSLVLTVPLFLICSGSKKTAPKAEAAVKTVEAKPEPDAKKLAAEKKAETVKAAPKADAAVKKVTVETVKTVEAKPEPAAKKPAAEKKAETVKAAPKAEAAVKKVTAGPVKTVEIKAEPDVKKAALEKRAESAVKQAQKKEASEKTPETQSPPIDRDTEVALLVAKILKANGKDDGTYKSLQRKRKECLKLTQQEREAHSRSYSVYKASDGRTGTIQDIMKALTPFMFAVSFETVNSKGQKKILSYEGFVVPAFSVEEAEKLAMAEIRAYSKGGYVYTKLREVPMATGTKEGLTYEDFLLPWVSDTLQYDKDASLFVWDFLLKYSKDRQLELVESGVVPRGSKKFARFVKAAK